MYRTLWGPSRANKKRSVDIDSLRELHVESDTALVYAVLEDMKGTADSTHSRTLQTAYIHLVDALESLERASDDFQSKLIVQRTQPRECTGVDDALHTLRHAKIVLDHRLMRLISVAVHIERVCSIDYNV